MGAQGGQTFVAHANDNQSRGQVGGKFRDGVTRFACQHHSFRFVWQIFKTKP
jgi:hypothetical protein